MQFSDQWCPWQCVQLGFLHSTHSGGIVFYAQLSPWCSQWVSSFFFLLGDILFYIYQIYHIIDHLPTPRLTLVWRGRYSFDVFKIESTVDISSTTYLFPSSCQRSLWMTPHSLFLIRPIYSLFVLNGQMFRKTLFMSNSLL